MDLSGCLSLAPFEDGAVGPDAMEDDGKLACDRDLRFLQADAFYEADAPCLQGRPSFRSVQQHAGCFEEIGSEQPITPFRDTPGEIELSRLLAPRRKAKIGAHRLCRS